jgi:hypothetical protein
METVTIEQHPALIGSNTSYLISRLMGLYGDVPTARRKEGKFWYRKARKMCKEISNNTGLPLVKVVGILSALSPSNKWERNCIDLHNFIATGGSCRVSTYGAQKAKAWRILHKWNTEKEVLAELNGVKTKAFFNNIYHCYTAGTVTLDRWGIRAAGFDSDKSLRKLERAELLEAYQTAAKLVNMRPHEFQAIIWEEIKSRPLLKGETA